MFETFAVGGNSGIFRNSVKRANIGLKITRNPLGIQLRAQPGGSGSKLKIIMQKSANNVHVQTRFGVNLIACCWLEGGGMMAQLSTR